MATPTNTAVTYSGVVNKEDLADTVYMISPIDTPFLSSIAKTSCSNTLHEWTTDTLATAANNAQLEGDDTTANAVGAGVRVQNRCQISRKPVRISGAQQAVQSAGKIYTMGYQKAKAGQELKRDIEFALTQNTAWVVGNLTTPRQLRGLEGWLATNNSLGAGGVAPVPTIANTPPTDGTQRTITEALVKDVLQKIFTSGGNPDLIILGSIQKQTFSTFTAGFTQMGSADDQKLNASINVYISDFGTLKIVPDRFSRSRTCFILETAKWAIAYLRPIQYSDLAKTGDSDVGQIICEYTLEARNEASSGAVRDLS